MNYFTYSIYKKELKKLGKRGEFVVAVYKTQIFPTEGDRVYFNNFEKLFVIEKVTPIDGVIDDEFARPYFAGFFELTLYRLCNNFEIVSVRDLYESDEFHESGFVANDAAGLYAQFEADLALAEAQSEGRLKVSKEDQEAIITKAKRKATSDFWGIINASIFCSDQCEPDTQSHFAAVYNPIVAYLDDYDPVAMMLFYRECDPDSHAVMESIPVSYVDMEVAERYNLTTEDLQYIVEELFSETLIDFNPETIIAVERKPIITIPESQVIFYKNLIEENEWAADQENGFGYCIFN